MRSAAECGGGIAAFGSVYRVENGNVQRSQDGETWLTVYSGGGINQFGTHNVIAFGYSPAP